MAVPKKNRLRVSRDILAVRRAGKKMVGITCTVWVRPGEERLWRVATVTSLKTAPRASTRNHLRRVVDAAAVEWFAKKQTPYDVVIAILPTAADAPPKSVREDVLATLKKSGIV